MSNPGSYYDERERRIAALDDLDGAELLAALGSLADLAEEHGDLADAVGWLSSGVQAASFHGRFADELAAFERLRALRAGNPADEQTAAAVRWFYKWIVERLPEYAEVTLDQMRAMLDAMQAEYESAGVGLKAVEQLRAVVAGQTGDLDAARRHYAKWEQADGDGDEDCPACQTNFAVIHHLTIDEPAAAFELADPLLTFEQHCDEVPAVTFSRLILAGVGYAPDPMLYGMHRLARPQVRKTPKLLGELGRHALFLAATGRGTEARRLLPTLVRGVAGTDNTATRYAVLRGVFGTAHRLGFDGVADVPLPAEAPVDVADGRAAVEDVKRWSADEALAAATALDARNGRPVLASRFANVGELFDRGEADEA